MDFDEYEYFFKNWIVLPVDESKSEIPNTPESKKWTNIEDDGIKINKEYKIFNLHISFFYYLIIPQLHQTGLSSS